MNWKALLPLSLAFMLCIFTACQPSADTGTETPKKQEVETKKEVTYKQSTEAFGDLEMKKLMSQVTKIELLFYLDDNTLSTDVETMERIRYFAIYIDPRPAKVPTYCSANGSALFFNDDGDIMIDAEFNNQKDCSFIAMKIQGKTYTHALTEEGRSYLQSFIDMGNNKTKTMKH